jgi:peptidoglycan/xylan/chitin deacetylase (PgdA/CDA1 family)
MQQHFAAAQFKAVFSVVTRPDLPQDAERWAQVAEWTRAGFELATHTAHHSNLDNPKWLEGDYQAEIVESAALITAKTGQPVRTLVTPYGSGYDTQNRAINPNVLAAARGAGLRFIIGIATGKRYVHMERQAGDIIYAGRIAPGGEYTVNDALYYIKYW